VTAAIILGVIAIFFAALGVVVWQRTGSAPQRMTPSAKRILFPFVGDRVSTPVLDAALRIARFESATLVPAYIATVPLQLNLDAPIGAECAGAMPLLEVVEQRAARAGVPVDARIETGRTPRHALRRLFDNERFDRLVVPAGAGGGFSPEDIAWLLENAPGEILVLRPAKGARTINGAGNNGHAPARRNAVLNDR
jgi:nucleotide-binding universal stress UspA family protein